MLRILLVIALLGCGKAFDDYASKNKSSEAKVQLDKLDKRAKVYFVEKGEYPRGKAATLPAKPCCEGPDRKCPEVPAAQWAADPVWAALEFTLEEPTRFQYAYESAAGKAFQATAVGDLDCDGVAITYTLDGTIEGGGPATKITEPTGTD